MEDINQLHILVSGKVQGVGFRSFTRGIAKELGILGGVRNLSNGKVEIMAQGKKELLDKFLRRIKESSPGTVEDIYSEKKEELEKFNDFNVVF